MKILFLLLFLLSFTTSALYSNAVSLTYSTNSENIGHLESKSLPSTRISITQKPTNKFLLYKIRKAQNLPSLNFFILGYGLSSAGLLVGIWGIFWGIKSLLWLFILSTLIGGGILYFIIWLTIAICKGGFHYM